MHPVFVSGITTSIHWENHELKNIKHADNNMGSSDTEDIESDKRVVVTDNENNAGLVN